MRSGGPQLRAAATSPGAAVAAAVVAAAAVRALRERERERERLIRDRFLGKSILFYKYFPVKVII